MAMERLTSSPHVINIYAFCGHSVITEFADGPRLGSLVDKVKKQPLKRLKIARDIASGLADIHGIDGDENATFIHFDVNPANVVVIGDALKFNDFNIGIPMRWNQTSNQRCNVRASYPNPQVSEDKVNNIEPHLIIKHSQKITPVALAGRGPGSRFFIRKTRCVFFRKYFVPINMWS